MEPQIAATEPLVHLTGAAPWRVALDAGALVDASLVSEGFVHLSRPDQVAMPAERLFAGRQDLLALAIDPARLRGEVRWEPGVAGDPAAMRFPHLYGPLPVDAVTSVVPYRPGPDGRFAAPTIPPIGDPLARAVAFERSLAERRAAAVEAVQTAPHARRRGHATALVGDALRRARAAGCDVIWLCCLADDWPRRWYERLGFVDAGARWEAVRPL